MHFFQPSSERSKTTILVKNLPAATPAQEIRQLFARHGELGRVVIPPSGITGINFNIILLSLYVSLNNIISYIII